jgi:hypothetical protein
VIDIFTGKILTHNRSIRYRKSYHCCREHRLLSVNRINFQISCIVVFYDIYIYIYIYIVTCYAIEDAVQIVNWVLLQS